MIGPTLPVPEWEDQLTLTVGSRGETVRHVQTFLNNYTPVTIDGHFGPRTQTAVQHVQAKLGIRPTTGIVDDRTWQALASAGILVQRDASKYRAPNGAEKDALFGPLKCEPLVAGQAGGPVRILNSFRQRIVSVVVPQLKGVQGTVAGQVQWHRDYVSELLGAFRAIEDAGLKDRIVSCAGTWVPRYVRGSTRTLSSHAYGTAIDINAPQNWLGARPARLGEVGCLLELVPHFEAHGFEWGGDMARADGMHFEISVEYARAKGAK